METIEGLTMSVDAQLRNLAPQIGMLVGIKALGGILLRLPKMRMGKQFHISIHLKDKLVLCLDNP